MPKFSSTELYVDQQSQDLFDIVQFDKDFVKKNKDMLLKMKGDNKDFIAYLALNNKPEYYRLMQSVEEATAGHQLLPNIIRHVKGCLMHKLSAVRRVYPNIWKVLVATIQPSEWQHLYVAEELEKSSLEAPAVVQQPVEETPLDVQVHVRVRSEKRPRLFADITDEAERDRLMKERRREGQRLWARNKRAQLKELARSSTASAKP